MSAYMVIARNVHHGSTGLKIRASLSLRTAVMALRQGEHEAPAATLGQVRSRRAAADCFRA